MSAQPAAPDENAWAAWTPGEVYGRIADVPRPWCVVGGWALDLWLGRQTRAHSDLEFTVLREDFLEFRQALGELDFYTVNKGVFAYLPTDRAPAPEIFQAWGFDRRAQVWRVDMMIEPGAVDLWVYKRATEVFGARDDMVGLSAEGIPYLSPKAVLLFKAKHLRAKDADDFHRVLPFLSPQDRDWLKRHLTRLHPGHGWIGML